MINNVTNDYNKCLSGSVTLELADFQCGIKHTLLIYAVCRISDHL